MRANPMSICPHRLKTFEIGEPEQGALISTSANVRFDDLSLKYNKQSWTILQTSKANADSPLTRQ